MANGEEKTTGLTLGKYAPLHKGHQLVIDTAIKEMDEVIVMIYDEPNITDIPLPVRAGWIRALYPSVTVIECRNGPHEVGYTPEIMKAHEDYVLKTLKGKKITHFYSSEPYGEHMSRVLGAVDRRVDQNRKAVPISGRILRARPYEHKHLIDPLVYRDLITNVVFLGAPSTGKSTMAEAMAKAYNTQFMPEYGREYWEMHQVDHRLTPRQLIEIVEEHIILEDFLLEKSLKYLFTDTNALTTYVFGLYYHGRVLDVLRRMTLNAQNRYDLIFLCGTDIPFEDTKDRSGAVSRDIMQAMIVDDLRIRRLPYVLLEGSIYERKMKVASVLWEFKKYGNNWRLR